MTIDIQPGDPVAGVAAPPRSGPVVAAVNHSPESWDALEWAAVEAAARGSQLQVVHVTSSPWLVTPYLSGSGVVDGAVMGAAGELVARAVAHAREVAPEVEVSGRVLHGAPTAKIVHTVDAGSLVVLGRSRRGWVDGRSLVARVVRRVHGQVAVVGLSDHAAPGPSAGRVVVGYDGTQDSAAALSTAFAEAASRGVGLTALRMPSAAEHPARIALAGDPMRRWRRSFPDVQVRELVLTDPVGPAVLAEAQAAALVVLPEYRRGLLRRRVRPGTRELVDARAASVIFVRP